MRRLCNIAALLCLLITPIAAQALTFEPFAHSEWRAEPWQFSRNPSDAMAIDRSGTVHLTGFIDNGNASRVEYLRMTKGQTPVRQPLLGEMEVHTRQPAIEIDANGGLHFAWQDYRHATAAANFIDNIEIYYGYLPPGDELPLQVSRVSHTEAAHQGDNGYMPQLAVAESGQVYLAWYDFTRDGNHADVFMRTTAAGEPFDDVVGIEPFRIARVESSNENASLWLPDVVHAGGDAFAVWGLREGFSGTFTLLGGYAGSLQAGTEPIVIAEQGAGFLDPPRVAANAAGEIAVAYSRFADGAARIFVQRLADADMRGGAMAASDGSLNASQPSVLYASNGRLWLAWQEDLGGFCQIVAAVMAPETGAVIDTQIVSDLDVDSRFPVLAASPAGRIYLAWIETGENEEKRVQVVRTPGTRVSDFGLHTQ